MCIRDRYMGMEKVKEEDSDFRFGVSPVFDKKFYTSLKTGQSFLFRGGSTGSVRGPLATWPQRSMKYMALTEDGRETPFSRGICRMGCGACRDWCRLDVW
eukprot:TRINITY_DN8561_c0_g1_i1.p2 TRINITY_DN8561_c0_g1~~TRINITY_DN8561_c0_g1_i1.p2  ORF type:complete len:100 (-),score=16.71 TRINITY_DN8561_c0_g1_i1:382-681(-)